VETQPSGGGQVTLGIVDNFGSSAMSAASLANESVALKMLKAENWWPSSRQLSKARSQDETHCQQGTEG
jgi:hypothetical protein